MLNDKSMGSIEEQVLPWLESRGIPLEHFRKLTPYLKESLYKKACLGIDELTGRIRDDILQILVVGEVRAEGLISPVDCMTDEQKRTFFDEKPTDWGC